MKKIFVLFALLAVALTGFAQQAVETKRTEHPFAFPEFRDAKVLQPFGRYTNAKANIFLKDSRLVFMDGDKIKTAYVNNVYGVEFGDSITYLRIDSIMGRVVARRGYDSLLRVTTIDMQKYSEQNSGGNNLPFFEMEDLNVFLEIDGDQREEAQGYPLKDTYYFMIKGVPYKATEKNLKKLIKPEMKKAFKNLMYDHYFSWNDEESLKKLFAFLPE